MQPKNYKDSLFRMNARD